MNGTYCRLLALPNVGLLVLISDGAMAPDQPQETAVFSAEVLESLGPKYLLAPKTLYNKVSWLEDLQ